MSRPILVAIAALATFAAVQPVHANLASNKLSVNGIMLNGTSLNALSANLQSGAIDEIHSITLPGQRTLTR
jgi:hypothetical protein